MCIDVTEDDNHTVSKWRGFAVRRGFPFNVSVEVNAEVDRSFIFKFQVGFDSFIKRTASSKCMDNL